MKYCEKCGKELSCEDGICAGCGCDSSKNTIKNTADAPNMGFAVLGFFLPLIGMILYLNFNESSPLKAKSAGKGALIGFCVSVAVAAFLFVMGGAIFGSFFSEL